jgi:hypothetical protein
MLREGRRPLRDPEASDEEAELRLEDRDANPWSPSAERRERWSVCDGADPSAAVGMPSPRRVSGDRHYAA